MKFVNFEDAALLLGQRRSEAQVIFEPNPKQRTAFLEAVKGNFSKKIKTAFKAGREAKR